MHGVGLTSTSTKKDGLMLFYKILNNCKLTKKRGDRKSGPGLANCKKTVLNIQRRKMSHLNLLFVLIFHYL